MNKLDMYINTEFSIILLQTYSLDMILKIKKEDTDCLF